MDLLHFVGVQHHGVVDGPVLGLPGGPEGGPVITKLTIIIHLDCIFLSV